MKKKSVERFGEACAEFLKPFVKENLHVPLGMQPIITISVAFEKAEVVPKVELSLEDKGAWVATDQEFGEEEFQAILALELTPDDRKFVEFFRKNNNKPKTMLQWTEAGFAEKGRFVSINKMCRDNGLRLGFRATVRGGSWPTQPHRFFVLKPKPPGKAKSKKIERDA